MQRQVYVLKAFFYFAQNILELQVYDEDRHTEDDHLLTVYFDVSKIKLGETVCLNFQLNPKVRTEITDSVSLPPSLQLNVTRVL